MTIDPASLPYMGDTPATEQDVVEEVTKLAAVIAAAVSAGGATGAASIDNRDTVIGEMVWQSKTRLMLALHSYVGHEIEGAIRAFAAGIDDALKPETRP